MKVLLYFEGQNAISKSGIGRAFNHQCRALESAGVEYTTDPWADDYDILHINTCYMNSDAIVKNARDHGKKVIYHAHSTEEDFRDSFTFSNALAPGVKKWLMHLYTQADALITPTPYSKKILEGYGIDLPIYPVSNGVDIQRYAPDASKITAFRKYFSLKPEDKVVLGVGLFFQRKGLLDFVEVARHLPQYKFIWFGSVSKVIIPPKINEVLEHHPDNVIFPGYVKGAIIEGAYSDADCFFFPSYEETEGIVVLEALAAKQQVIVRDIGVFNPWLISEKNCYKGNDNNEFVRLIEGTIEGSLPKTREEGYLTAQERSIEGVGQQLKHVYEEVLNGAEPNR
ncbi:MAG: glycosyltransferase [Erysipelotrichaceae bacterium]|jgi:1,2-diacylglycerol-3-alpha-glucose alpha-1,2-glucosyltransferase|nr:glycosyltransferase [Erysipelotrichaceae bacterium]